MLDSIDTHHGMPHLVCRSNLYNDCFTLYEQELATIKMEYPFRVTFQDEQAVDTGGVAKDMFSGFWELAYTKDMDGGSTYVPMVHPHTKLFRYKILGAILAHGFMSSGFIPIRLSFPVLAFTLLGCDVEIPPSIVVDSFIDYVSDYDGSLFHDALKASRSQKAFSPCLQGELVRVLGGMGCRKVPSSHNIVQLITEVAHHELMVKPLAATCSLRAGVPAEYFPFLNEFSVARLYKLCIAISVTPQSVLGVLSVRDDLDANQARVFSYLKTFIGNLPNQDLRDFVRFVTGSSVLIDKKFRLHLMPLLV